MAVEPDVRETARGGVMSQGEQAALIVAAIGFLTPVVIIVAAGVSVMVGGAVWTWKRRKQ